MKNIFILLIFLILNQTSWSQISEEERTMSEGINIGYVLTIPKAKEKFIQKTWKSYLKENGVKIKRNKKEKEFNAPNVYLGTISESSLQLYSRIEMGIDGGIIILWLEDGDYFIASNTHPEESKKAEIFMMKFALKLTIDVIKKELDDEESKLKKLNKKINKLTSANKSLTKSIKKANETIKESKKEIASNKEKQGTLKIDIKAQDDVVEKIQKKLADLEIDY